MPKRSEHPLAWCLDEVGLVQGLSEQEQLSLLNFVKPTTYERHETLFFPGTPSDAVYFLHRGLVKLYCIDPSGKRLTLGLVCHRVLYRSHGYTLIKDKRKLARVADQRC